MDVKRYAVIIAVLLGLALASTSALAAVLTRNPYLQLGTSDGVTVRWRTDVETDSRVLCGPAPGSLSLCAEDPTPTSEHIVPVTGLSADTLYYYAIGSSSEILAGDDAEHYFVTHPIAGTSRPIRAWVLGDSGFGSQDQADVRDAYITFTGATHTDLWLHLGDISQTQGTDEQYQTEFFDMYPTVMRQTVMWPTFGNHDSANSNSAAEVGPYYGNFTLPRSGEAGGVPSGTAAYYSFDYGNVHFIVLNSTDLSRLPTSPMLTWVQADLAATAQDWIIAYWHHPPYSKGSHDSDTELNMYEMRQYALPILEDNGVDLVMNGHSHAYERSYLIDGHYGDSSEFGVCLDNGTPADPSDDYCLSSPSTPCPNGVIDCDFGGFIEDAGDGSETGDGAYLKPLLGPDPHHGTIYTVAGTGGQVRGGTLDHPAMLVALNVLGSVVLDIDSDRLDVLFLDDTGSIRDEFTIIKGADIDGDDVVNEEDNCPEHWNPAQEDADSDGFGDVCDLCPYDPDNDIDSDEVCGDVDNCPDDHNPCQWDADDDGIGDVCDTSSPESCNIFAEEDAWLKEASPSENNGKDDKLLAQSLSGDSMRPVVRFDLSSVPPSANLVSATAWLWVESADVSGLPINLHRITAPWSESTVNWSLLGSAFDPTIEGSFTTIKDKSWEGAEIGALVRAWVDGTYTNDGTMLIPTSSGDKSEFKSRDGTPVSRRPCMQVVTTCASTEQDSDSDGVPDGEDGCPFDPGKIEPGICGCGVPDIDEDSDGIIECLDPCPGDPGNDPDGDTICALDDNCPDIANVLQTDTDSDGLGDFCDECILDGANDDDSDGACADVDNCPGAYNPGQDDWDSDDLGDICDICVQDPDNDFDFDGWCGDADNCPGTHNPGQADSDSDGIGDACDNQSDTDGDGVPNGSDNCPLTINPVQRDEDGDSAGDACDVDDDDDGVIDGEDCARLERGVSSPPGPVDFGLRFEKIPDTVLRWKKGVQGHASHVYRGSILPGWPPTGASCVDYENPDVESLQPEDPTPGELFYFMVAAANVCGTSSPGEGTGDAPRAIDFICPPAHDDADGDTVSNLKDNCSMVPDETLSDIDHDFVGDLCDNCPLLSNPDQADGNSDGVGDACTVAGDSDSDGVADDVDNCPDHFNPYQYDADTDGLGDACDDCPLDPDNDIDSDGACGNVDNCPVNPNPAQTDADTDGLGDACDDCPLDPENDIDSDGHCGNVDNCPEEFNPCQWDGDSNGTGDVCDVSSPAACNVLVDRDAWLKESAPDENHGDDEELKAKNSPSDNMRPVLHFAFSTLPSGANVVSATAWLRVKSEDDSGDPVNVHRVTADWAEDTVSWNVLGSQYDPAVEASFTPIASDSWEGVGITSLVLAWLEGTHKNDGIMLIPTSDGLESIYTSVEWPQLTEHPCLHVVATCVAP